jgi:hypothetical protein
MRIVLSIVLLGFVLLPIHDAFGRPGDSRPLHRHSQAVAQKVVELRGRLLREMVGLSEARADAVERVLQSFDDEHQTYSAMLDAAQRKMRSLLDENSDDAKAYAVAVEDVRVAHDYLHQLRDRQFRAMQKILEPKEQAIFFESLGKLRHEVRKRMRHAKHGKRHPRRKSN